MKTVKLDNRILDDIKTAAHHRYINKSELQIDPSCLSTYHIIMAFCEYVRAKEGVDIEADFKFRPLGPR